MLLEPHVRWVFGLASSPVLGLAWERREDFVFRSSFERALWVELEQEVELEQARLGPTWIAEGAFLDDVA